MARAMAAGKKRQISYSRWGYFFITPFFIIYVAFSLFPLLSTFYNSLFENYRIGLTQVGPKYVGLDNYGKIIIESKIYVYAWNTIIL